MANYNRIIIMGNLTRDPDYKQLASGQAVCRLGLACNRQFKNRQTDTMVQEVCFVDVDVWGAQADSCRQYLQKGRPVLVEGRLKFDSWQDNNGQTRSKHSIVADRVLFLSGATTAETSDALAKKPSDASRTEANVQLEKELLDQIEQIKARSEVKPATKAAPQEKEETTQATASTEKPAEKTPASDLNFKDEPPFQDDLPF